MIIHTMQQGSDEWFDVKCGKISASHIKDIMAKGTGKTRKKYMMKLLYERKYGIYQHSYSNGDMQWGIEHEEEAREAYEMEKLVVTEQVGFVEIDDYLGYSPDAFVGDDGGLELKCPLSTTHLQYILEPQSLVKDYSWQLQGTLWMSGRERWDICSFDPRTYDVPLLIVSVERDEEKIKQIAVEVELFKDKLKELESKVKGGM